MFGEFLKRLSAAEAVSLPDQDARLAVCALLVRVARTDGDYDPQEQVQIDAILSARFGLDPAACAALRAEGEAVEAEAPDTVRFTREIKDAVAFEDRRAVVEAMWQVALADGSRDDRENALLRLVASLLGINDRDSAIARQRVESRL